MVSATLAAKPPNDDDTHLLTNDADSAGNADTDHFTALDEKNPEFNVGLVPSECL